MGLKLQRKTVKKQSSKLPYHKSCETLPLRKLIKLQNSGIDGNGDNRHILVTYDWDYDYEDNELSHHVDNIYKEWQEITGNNFYDSMFEMQDKIMYDYLRIEALNCMYLALKLNQIDIANDISVKFKLVGLKSLYDIAQKIKQIETKISDAKDLATNRKEINFYDLITNLKTIFPKVDFNSEITCAEYASWIRQTEKQEQNGE